MKKRTTILPLAMFLLMSCSPRPDADVRNQYDSENDCIKDNPKDEIRKNLDEDDDFDSNKLCEHVSSNGHTYYLGPAYPYSYYGHYGYYNGYWIGRSSAYSRGVTYESGQTFSHSEIAAKGGITSVVSTAKATPSASISRGGFGSFGASSAVGS